MENGATVVVSRDGRQVARIIPETDSAEQKRAALKASGTFDWSGRRPKSSRPSVRLRDGGSVNDIIINERLHRQAKLRRGRKPSSRLQRHRN